ncbi:hypothetical protein Zm00014a_012076 [Zea mays]|uniref:Uncharacterized protein n=1 Tax=Zea mays TaxID=4577 RepID=A0A3L6G4W9_MAIZE|nr:hypothetical protein Zm00014a_012076 [Zea mays]
MYNYKLCYFKIILF